MKPTVALFVHQPKCSIQSGNGIIQALESQYNFRIFTRHELDDDFLDDIDIIAFPGGIGDSDSYDYLLRDNRDSIKRFIRRGGRYLGICMGAYWADQNYFDILTDARAVQYITRPGTDTRRPHAKAQRVLWNGEEERMFFYDGCAIVGKGIAENNIWALYPNGDPMAVIQNRIGLIGCHPESTQSWYQSYSWMTPHWHNYRHHTLLLEFVNELMKR